MIAPTKVSFNGITFQTGLQKRQATSEIIFEDSTLVKISFDYAVDCYYNEEFRAYVEQRVGKPSNFVLSVVYEDPASLETTKQFSDNPLRFSRLRIKSNRTFHKELVAWCSERKLNAEAIYACYLHLVKP